MPGIASDRSPGIQIGPIAAIGNEVQPTPAIGNLMDAFNSGFLSVNDIQRRTRENASENDLLKTQLQAGDIQRRLAPGAAENALAAQGLTADQIQAAKAVLPGQTQITLGGQAATQDELTRQENLRSPDDTVRNAALAHETVANWEHATGTTAPSTIKVENPNPEPVKSYSKWLNEVKSPEVEKATQEFEGQSPEEAQAAAEERVKNFQSSFPLNSPEDNVARAKFSNAQEDALKAFEQRRSEYGGQLMKRLADTSTREYEQYKNSLANQTTVLKKGTPEYTAEVQKRLQVLVDSGAVRAAKLAALPKVLETQAAAPVKAAEEAKKNAMVLQKEYGTRQEIQDLRKVQAAFYKLDRLLDPSVPPSAPRDQGAIFSWMKILDPGSTVREGEYATAKNARAVPDKILAFYNQVRTGQILTPDQRNAFKEAVEPVFLGQVQAAAPTIKQFLLQEGSAIGEVVPPEDAALLKRLSPSAGSKTLAPAGSKTLVPTEGPYKGKTLKWVGPGPTDYAIVQ